MTEPNWPEIRARLAGKWPQNLIRKATKQGGKVYSYLDARDLMAFLDEVVGPQHWSTESEVVDSAACVVRCTLSIHGIPKTDFGYPNNPVGGGNKFAEPLKEAQTDAFKRAAVLWGPGREFYTDISNYRWSTEDPPEHPPTPARDRERYTPAQRDAMPEAAKREAERARAAVQSAIRGSERPGDALALEQPRNADEHRAMDRAIGAAMLSLAQRDQMELTDVVERVKAAGGLTGSIKEQPMDVKQTALDWINAELATVPVS